MYNPYYGQRGLGFLNRYNNRGYGGTPAGSLAGAGTGSTGNTQYTQSNATAATAGTGGNSVGTAGTAGTAGTGVNTATATGGGQVAGGTPGAGSNGGAANAYGQFANSAMNWDQFQQQMQAYQQQRQQQMQGYQQAMEAWQGLRPERADDMNRDAFRQEMQDWRGDRPDRPEFSPFEYKPPVTAPAPGATNPAAGKTSGPPGAQTPGTKSNTTSYADGGMISGAPYAQQIVYEDPRMQAMRYMQMLANQRRG